MIINRVYRLKKESSVTKELKFPAGQEIEIVMNVVYMAGYPLPRSLQKTMMNWITGNKELFDDVTINWKKG